MNQGPISGLIKIFTLSMLAFLLVACGRASTLPSGETEAKEYLGVELTPISQQRNNAIKGTQRIDKDNYRLAVDGVVDNPLNLTYADILSFPMESRLATLHCVEGWSFIAKWTGPTLASILEEAQVEPNVTTVIFYTADDSAGYTSLDLQYILDENIIIALKLNDVTLPPDRGFPFQVVAEGKYGYKWAKWVTHIEASDNEDFRGYWESRGYNNNADINGPAFE